MKDSYILMKELFDRKSSFDPSLGPGLSFLNFKNIAISSSLLTECDENIEKENELCEIAYAHALLTTRMICLKNNYDTKVNKKEEENKINESKRRSEEKEGGEGKGGTEFMIKVSSPPVGHDFIGKEIRDITNCDIILMIVV